jgi:hypothetical protein
MMKIGDENENQLWSKVMIFTREDKYKYSVISVTSDLHSLCTGSMGWEDVRNHKEYAAWLDWRVNESWDDPIDSFEFALKELVLSALRIYKNRTAGVSYG